MSDVHGVPRPGGELANLSFGEMVALVVLSGPLLASASLAVGVWRRTTVNWLLQQHVLVQAPLVPVPGLGGPGLDLPRILVAAGTVGLVLAAGISALLRRWTEQAAGGRVRR